MFFEWYTVDMIAALCLTAALVAAPQNAQVSPNGTWTKVWERKTTVKPKEVLDANGKIGFSQRFQNDGLHHFFKTSERYPSTITIFLQPTEPKALGAFQVLSPVGVLFSDRSSATVGRNARIFKESVVYDPDRPPREYTVAMAAGRGIPWLKAEVPLRTNEQFGIRFTTGVWHYELWELR